MKLFDKIIELYQDEAQMWRVRVQMKDNEESNLHDCFFLKFDHYPTLDEINSESQNYLNFLNNTPE